MQNPLNKFPIHAGMLSFLLPGLGQLFQKRIAAALLCFTAYIALLALAQYRIWIFFPMAFAAWEAQRQPNQTFVTWNARTFSFFIVGAIAFFSAFSLLADRVLPYPAIGKMSFVAEHLSEQIKGCAVVLKKMPTSLAECTGLQAHWRNDPWGAPFRYRYLNPGFEIRSLGRDGKEDTEDDFVYLYNSPGGKR